MWGGRDGGGVQVLLQFFTPPSSHSYGYGEINGGEGVCRQDWELQAGESLARALLSPRADWTWGWD